MKHSSINTRLLLGMAAIIVFLVAQAVFTFLTGRSIESTVVDTAHKNTLAAKQLGELAVLAQQIRRYEKEYFVYVANAEKATNYEREWTATATKITGSLVAMRSNAGAAFSADDLAQIAKWEAAADFYDAEMNKIFEAAKLRAVRVAAATPNTAMYAPSEVNEMIKAGKDRLSNDLIKGVAAMSAEKSKATLALAGVATQGFNKLIYGVLASVVLGIAIALLLVVSLPGSVSRPIKELTDIVHAMSKGKTDVAIKHGGAKEFEGLAGALERMRVAQGLMIERLRSHA